MAKKDSVAMLEDKIEVLTRARGEIKNGNSNYICLALASVADKKPKLFNAGDKLTDYICKALNNRPSLSGWIKTSSAYSYVQSEDIRFMRKARLQWIDWMLASLADDLRKRPVHLKRGIAK